MEEYFRQLRAKPTVAWPTVFLLLACLSAIAFSWYRVLNDLMPLWAGFLVNVIAYYYLFSPLHDAAHRAVARNEKLNNFFVTSPAGHM